MCSYSTLGAHLRAFLNSYLWLRSSGVGSSAEVRRSWKLEAHCHLVAEQVVIMISETWYSRVIKT